MTVKATWLGGPGEPESCEWMGVVFPKDEPVEITNDFMIRKAKGNKFFVVDDPEGGDEPAKPTKADNLAKARAVKAAAKAAADAAKTEKIDA